MENYFDIIKKCPLFTGINESDLQTLLQCLSAHEKLYEKNSFIFIADDIVTLIGIVLSGNVHIVREDIWAAVRS